MVKIKKNNFIILKNERKNLRNEEFFLAFFIFKINILLTIKKEQIFFMFYILKIQFKNIKHEKNFFSFIYHKRKTKLFSCFMFLGYKYFIKYKEKPIFL